MAKPWVKPTSKHVAPPMGVGDLGDVSLIPLSCSTCKYWHKLERPADTGQCRRYPPVPTGDSFGSIPLTSHDFICGEYASKGGKQAY